MAEGVSRGEVRHVFGGMYSCIRVIFSSGKVASFGNQEFVNVPYGMRCMDVV